MVGSDQPNEIFAIAPTDQTCSTAGGTGTRYADAAMRTGGEVLSICASDYSPLLSAVASKAFSPADRFALSALPDPGSLVVSVDGIRLAGGWTYDPASNQVVFANRPGPGSRLSVYYRKACP